MCIFWSGCPHRAAPSNNGLDECMLAISDCIAKVSAESRGSKPFLIGHSLGGTLAAIYGALAPATIRGLVLLGAPLCFQPAQSQFRDALVSLVPSTLSDADPFPGSLLSHVSALASPDTFIWSRLMDAALSLTDRHAMEIHARIERWTLDEIALPGKLVHQIVEWLYRENRLCRGALKIGEHACRPVLACQLQPLRSLTRPTRLRLWPRIKPFTDAMPAKNVRIMEYPRRSRSMSAASRYPGRAGSTGEGLAGHHLLAQFPKLKRR